MTLRSFQTVHGWPGIAVNESPARLVLRCERLKADAPHLFTSEIEPAVANQLSEQNRKLISILELRADRLKIDTPDDGQQIGFLEEVIEERVSSAAVCPLVARKQPFFLDAAYTATHWSMHALEKDI